MNQMKDTVTIAWKGGSRERPGVIVGRGLAVVELPGRNEDDYARYCITHVPSGKRIRGFFFSHRLAQRCAREFIKLISFQGNADEAYLSVSIHGDAIAEIGRRYDYLDDLWLEREEQRCQIYPSC